MTDTLALPLIYQNLLTCPVCQRRLVRLATAWGCPHGMDHTGLMADGLLKRRIARDLKIPYDSTPDDRYVDDEGKSQLLEGSGREKQLNRLLRELKYECGAKTRTLSTKRWLRRWQRWRATVPNPAAGPEPLCAYNALGWFIAFGSDAERLVSRYQWYHKEMTFISRDKEGNITEKLELLFARSEFDLLGQLRERLSNHGVILG